MDEHDRKLDRVETERIELMEICPVCGEQRRNSARFCTTCGHRFASDEIENTQRTPSPVSSVPDIADSVDPVISGWPAPATSVSNSPWAPAGTSGGWPTPPVEPATPTTASEATWAQATGTAPEGWTRLQPDVDDTSGVQSVEAFEVVEVDDAPGSDLDKQHSDEGLRQRARSLLNELQETIEGLTGGSAITNEALARELEISLTQPAALEGEAIADLRAAAEAAQARPRDLDTLTAFTAQAETILALIVGYERSTAGIERAIESLRADPSRRKGSEDATDPA